ncbi:MAG TPA: hypothetical protein VER75_07675 [Thermoleophilaceae bacterium]|nr:hypothetical protein [Thermoleophilaceae bacterium]
MAERCVDLVPSRDVPLLCPVWLPSRGWHGRLLTGTRCEYLVDFNANHAGGLGAFHALAGGRCGEFSLQTRRGGWPAKLRRTRDLRLVGTKPLKPGQKKFELVRLRVLRRVRIAGHRGLLLKAVPYPSGGVHGGHIAAVWSQDGAGYAVSLHFEPRPSAAPTQKRAAVLQAAEAMSGFTPPSADPGS